MPRWKALPDELDPEVREFAEQLRRLVDRSGLSIAAVSDHTGYSKTSWERYLNGRILAPKGAVVALAEVTGTSPIHLTTMWELAERAWSRAEMRHDRTMEQIRISQARAALGEYGQAAEGTGSRGRRTAAPEMNAPSGGFPPAGSGSAGSPGPAGSVGSASATGRPGAAGPAGSTSPAGPTGSEGERDGQSARSPWGGPATPTGPITPPTPPSARGGHRAVPPPGGRNPGGSGGPGGAGGSGGAPAPGGKRRLIMFLAGVVGALVVIVAAVLLTDLGGDGDGGTAAKTPSPTATTNSPKLPAGVKCSGKECTGKDPEQMGCGGEFAKTIASATVGQAKVEVRHSEICKAAWARVTQAAPGDAVEISAAGKGKQNGLVNADKDAYTPMTAVRTGAEAKACATLTTGVKGCTGER
ncbi:helix-turn-helix domain-containing protein [Streptomyces sp. NPDC055078]